MFDLFRGRFFVALLQRQCAGGAATHLQDVLVRLNFNGFYNMNTTSSSSATTSATTSVTY